MLGNGEYWVYAWVGRRRLRDPSAQEAKVSPMRLRVLFYARVCYSTLASTTCTVTTFTDFTFVTVAAVGAGARVSVSFSPSPNPTLTTDSDLTQPQTPTLSRRTLAPCKQVVGVLSAAHLLYGSTYYGSSYDGTAGSTYYGRRAC